MSAALDALARDKEALLARSTLCRLRLRRQASALRGTVPAVPRVVRFVAAGVRVVLLAKLALSLIGHARKLAGITRR